MSVNSFTNNPNGDDGWFVHTTNLYFAGKETLVCANHAGMLLQPVTTLDIEHGLEPQCFLCKGGSMHGLRFRIRRVVHGPIWGTDQTNPKYKEAFYQAVEWAEEGLLFKGYCPTCGKEILDDQLDCDPRGAAGERAEVFIQDKEGNVKLSICWECHNDHSKNERAHRIAFP